MRKLLDKQHIFLSGLTLHTVRTCEWQRKRILKLVFILPSIRTTNFIIFGNFQKNITWFQKNVNLQKIK